MFCFHNWKVHSVSITKSIVDKLRENGLEPSMVFRSDFEREKIVVLRCSKCNHLKQIKMNEEAMIIYPNEDIVCGSVPSTK